MAAGHASDSDSDAGGEGQYTQLLMGAFGTVDVYEILGVPRDADNKAITRAYRKRSLKYHPDKNKHPSATAKFQALSLSHSILSDSKKRAQFDASGSVEDAESAQDLAAWSEYWRSLFPKVTVTKIDAFADEYRGSEEERQDVLRAFVQHEGDMKAMLEHIMLSSNADAERFFDLTQAAVKAGEVQQQMPHYAQGLPEAEVVRLMAARAKKLTASGQRAAAKKQRKGKRGGGGDDPDAALVAAIRGRGGGGGGGGGGILAALAARHGVDLQDVPDALPAPPKRARKGRRAAK